MSNLVHKVIGIGINLFSEVTEVTESEANVLSDTYKPLRAFLAWVCPSVSALVVGDAFCSVESGLRQRSSCFAPGKSGGTIHFLALAGGFARPENEPPSSE